ncbi:MAG TPA: peptidoglycan-binding domain-containing protein [Streptomyces sp.]|nr:peptidoglycan-binding domain-containing protein [Streptomyces sp.]
MEALSQPTTQPDRGPDPADLAMFPKGPRGADGATSPFPATTPARRRPGRGLVLAMGGTALAVAGSGALVAGLFLQGDDPFDGARFDGRGGAPTAALPGDAPAEETAGASPDGSATATSSPSAPASPSASTDPSPESSPLSSGPGAPSTTPAVPGSAAPPPAPSGASDGNGRGWGHGSDGRGHHSPVLREGDSGPEVRELQHRLRQTHTYGGGVDGRYDSEVREGVERFQERYGVRGDPRGVYGPHTRWALESATQAPG